MASTERRQMSTTRSPSAGVEVLMVIMMPSVKKSVVARRAPRRSIETAPNRAGWLMLSAAASVMGGDGGAAFIDATLSSSRHPIVFRMDNHKGIKKKPPVSAPLTRARRDGRHRQARERGEGFCSALHNW
ncbi:MAG: hypothetical protein ACN6O8_14735 [Achromobacter sp.]|uniref:hypothetical protein n=1 Tax=Achromobacter sp. TaxID=134375 RepID=UPI003D064D8A